MERKDLNKGARYIVNKFHIRGAWTSDIPEGDSCVLDFDDGTEIPRFYFEKSGLKYVPLRFLEVARPSSGLSPAELRAEADRIEAEQKKAEEEERALAWLTDKQRGVLKVLQDRKDAFGCQREHVIALASALCGADLGKLLPK